MKVARHEFLVVRREGDTPTVVTWKNGQVEAEGPQADLLPAIEEMMDGEHPHLKVVHYADGGEGIMIDGPPVSIRWGGKPRESVADFFALLKWLRYSSTVVPPEGIGLRLEITDHSEPGVVY